MRIRLLLVFSIFFASLSNLHAAETVSVGAILPLSGKFAAFGNKALQGIELAIEQYHSKGLGKKHPVKLLIKDSQGLPETAGKAVKELDEEGVNIIIGPILGITSESAAKKAQDIGIPIVTMTQKENISEIGDWVFRNCMTNATQIKGLAEYALKNGIKNVAVFYPDNQYGKELSALFTQEMIREGGKVVASQSYKDGQTDFGNEIKALVGQKFLTRIRAYNEKLERQIREMERAGKTFDKDQLKDEKPRPGFDAVFIPDYAERVGLIIPQLAFYDVKGVKLLGAGGWNSPVLVKMAGDFLGNTVFVDGFFSGSRRPIVTGFVAAYKNTFGDEPGILEAQAFDTAGIVLSIVAGGGSTREGIRDRIGKIKDYQGVSGDITFTGRDAERSFYYLTGGKGVIEEIIEP